jgi:hypothetical protein
MSTAAQAVYGTLGIVATGLGLVVLVQPALALPAEAYSPLTAHLVREQGAEGLFIGIMALWCLFNQNDRRLVHLALLAFFLLFSALHWVEYFHDRRSLVSPLINSLPFLMLLAVTPFKPRAPHA